MGKSSRNYGIDILRIASMVGVVFLHVLSHGKILHLNHSPLAFSAVWFLEILAYPAVNCFVLISGYVGYKDENVSPKFKNLISLWFTVVFYCVLIYSAFVLFGTETFGVKTLLKNFLPIVFKKYWFFSAYFGLFLLTPLLNLLVLRSNSKQAFIFLLCFVLFVAVTTIGDVFSLQDGYSLIWFILIYLIGAIFKKYRLSELLSKKVWFFIALSAFLLTWGTKLLSRFTEISFVDNHVGSLVSYVSPTIVLMAIGLLGLFSKIKCTPSFAPIISFFATSAFSVYLMHDNFYVRKGLMGKLGSYAADLDPILLTLFVIGCVSAIFFACIMIDKIRILIFKLARIDTLSAYIELTIKKAINITYNKIGTNFKKITK